MCSIKILRGNITPGMCVLDAGCGYGRNLVHLLREGCKVFALDEDRGSRGATSGKLSASLMTELPAENFQVGRNSSKCRIPDGIADVVICNAVLHFARDEEHFRAMLTELWRVLRPRRDAVLPVGFADRHGL